MSGRPSFADVPLSAPPPDPAFLRRTTGGVTVDLNTYVDHPVGEWLPEPVVDDAAARSLADLEPADGTAPCR